MVKKFVEIEVCDICLQNDNDYIEQCKGCGKMICEKCIVGDEWKITDISLCNKCHDKVMKNMESFLKTLKE
jgi:hypothetical protein